MWDYAKSIFYSYEWFCLHNISKIYILLWVMGWNMNSMIIKIYLSIVYVTKSAYKEPKEAVEKISKSWHVQFEGEIIQYLIMDEKFLVITKDIKSTITCFYVWFSKFNFAFYFFFEAKKCGRKLFLCFIININWKACSGNTFLIWHWYNDWMLYQIVDKLISTIEWKLVNNNMNRVYALAAIQLIHNSWNEILKM